MKGRKVMPGEELSMGKCQSQREHNKWGSHCGQFWAVLWWTFFINYLSVEELAPSLDLHMGEGMGEGKSVTSH